MSVREIAQLTPNYCEINREERNYAAILFAALCKPGNSRRFSNQCGFETKPGVNFGIYFEYSYLRDLWKKIDSEEIKKEIIRRNLRIKGIDAILDSDPEGINLKFGVGGNVSTKYVEYPGKWSIPKYHKKFDDDDFLKICKFKWAFNIKPDIVIHLDKNSAICIEAKLESGEGSYPSTQAEKKIFDDRRIKHVKQTKLQMYMMQKLLGLKTKFMFLVRKGKESEKHEKPRIVHWKTAFGWLDLDEMPCFAIEMVNRISK